jgi:multimeric flavodoxin WrbA
MKTGVFTGSGRREGNTEELVNRVVKSLDAEIYHLLNFRIQPITDLRHTEEGFSSVDDDADALVRKMLTYDVLIFATPLYWYTMSGHMKNFIDRWSQFLRDEELEFLPRLEQKQAYLIVTSGDKRKLTPLPLVQQFEYICQFTGMKFADYLLGFRNKPKEILDDASALAKAEEWNKELKKR